VVKRARSARLLNVFIITFRGTGENSGVVFW